MAVTVLHGVDTSKYQGSWDNRGCATALVPDALGWRWQAFKATQDDDELDPAFVREWADAGQVAGVARIAYHFVGLADPARQAAYFAEAIARVGGLRATDTVMIDVEPDKGAGVGEVPGDHVAAVLRQLGAWLDRRPLVYVGAFHPAASHPFVQQFPWALPWWQSNQLPSTRALLGVGVSSRVAQWPVVLWQFGLASVPGAAAPIDADMVIDAHRMVLTASSEPPAAVQPSAVQPSTRPVSVPAAHGGPPSAALFPLLSGHWFGTESADPRNHSGAVAADHPLVEAVQQRFADRGWRLVPTGHFGDETLRVVLAFQREKGLGIDGHVGPETWTALWSAPITP